MKDLHPSKLLLGIATPFIAAGSAWLAATVGKYGVHLDPSGINALATAGAVAGGTAMVKLIHDVETDVEKKDSKLAAEVKVVASDTVKVADTAVAVDPQLDTAAAQAEQAAVAKSETLAADVWPQEPAGVSDVDPTAGGSAPSAK